MSVHVPSLPEASKVASYADNRPTAAVITNFLNNYYTNYKFADSVNGPVVRFRTVTSKNADSIASKPVIDVNDCEPFKAYSTVCGRLQKVHPATKLSKQELTAITAGVYDGRLRGLLEIAANAVIKPPKPAEDKKQKKQKQSADEPKEKVERQPKENAFEKYVLPALRFGTVKEQSIGDNVNAINAFFTNKDKLRTRVYNICFPHAVHNPDKPAKGVNLIYLQHTTKFHDNVLKMLVENAGDRDILQSVQSEFIGTFSVDLLKQKNSKELPKLEKEELESLLTQLANPELITFILNPPTVNVNGEMKLDGKWIDTLKAIKFGSKKAVVQLERGLTKFERMAVRLLVNELHATLSFVKLVHNAFAANRDDDINECFEKYNAILADINSFYKEHKPKVNNHETFITYLMESVMFIKDLFEYKSPIRGFVTDLITASRNSKSGSENVSFKFNNATRKLMDEVVVGFRKEKKDGPQIPVTLEEQLPKIIDAFKVSWAETSNPLCYDVNKLEIYSKLGKLVPAAIGKQYKVAIGILLVQFLFEQVKLQRAANSKKKELVIYVKL